MPGPRPQTRKVKHKQDFVVEPLPRPAASTWIILYQIQLLRIIISQAW